MNTRPAKHFDPAKDLLYQPKEQRCPKCGATMRRGYLSETSPIRIAEVMERVYWSSDEAGPMGARATTRAYACPDCGYIELFIRRIDKNREIVMKAPS
ncbi:MAG: PF20097 family protein [Candidatus Bathyarchaeota archaeon]|nr:PF20097 family protein [Candidatus Bathyarchaeota archaeon]